MRGFLFAVCVLLAACDPAGHPPMEKAHGAAWHNAMPLTLDGAYEELGYRRFAFSLVHGDEAPPAVDANGVCLIRAGAWTGDDSDGWSDHVGRSAYACLAGEAALGEPMAADHSEAIWLRVMNGHCAASGAAACANLRARTVDLQSLFWVYVMGFDADTRAHEETTAGYLGHELAHIVHGYFHE